MRLREIVAQYDSGVLLYLSETINDPIIEEELHERKIGFDTTPEL